MLQHLLERALSQGVSGRLISPSSSKAESAKSAVAADRASDRGWHPLPIPGKGDPSEPSHSRWERRKQVAKGRLARETAYLYEDAVRATRERWSKPEVNPARLARLPSNRGVT